MVDAVLGGERYALSEETYYVSPPCSGLKLLGSWKSDDKEGVKIVNEVFLRLKEYAECNEKHAKYVGPKKELQIIPSLVHFEKWKHRIGHSKERNTASDFIKW